MINTTFETYKLKRELARSGKTFRFTRRGLNNFGEPMGLPEELGSLRGLYHEQNSNIQITTGETTQIRTKKIPMILCLAEDAKPLDLQTGDVVEINGRVFLVTGIVDIQEWNLIFDISLELVDDVTED